MNGAESLVHSLLASGITVCFGNPGTSEMHFVAALDRIPGLRCVLGLQENVVTGMADGYWRVAGRPAATLLHCGPGLANGLANLHNARRARSGIVNVVGDQATYHRPLDAPLTADTEGFARGVSGWVRTVRDAASVGADATTAVQAALTSPGQVATLILPADAAWDEGGEASAALPAPAIPVVDPHAVQQAAQTLRRAGDRVLLLLGGAALREHSLRLARRIQAATGCAVLAECNNALIQRGNGRLAVGRVPYVAERAIAALAPFDQLILVNANPPVGFFAYPGLPGRHYPEHAHVQVLARLEQDAEQALAALTDALAAPAAAMPPSGPRPQPARGAPTPNGLADTLAALMPDDSIVVDEAISYGPGVFAHTADAAPHDWLQLTGGAIGCGLPLATGAALAVQEAGKDRRVIALQADGSALYTLQALWTQARETLPVTTILLANRKYQILLGEYAKVGANAGRTALDMLDLANPAIDWVQIANGMGVEAARAETMEACNDLLAHSFGRAAPFLIELMI